MIMSDCLPTNLFHGKTMCLQCIQVGNSRNSVLGLDVLNAFIAMSYYLSIDRHIELSRHMECQMVTSQSFHKISYSKQYHGAFHTSMFLETVVAKVVDITAGVDKLQSVGRNWPTSLFNPARWRFE